MELKELQQRRKNNLEYYKKAKDNGEKRFYTLAPGDRCCNTQEGRNKRRYGFSRTSVHQRRRLSKALVAHRKRLSQAPKYKCYSWNCYVSTKQINKYHKDKDYIGLMGYIYSHYNNPQTIIDDYLYGFKDPLVCRLVSITGILKYEDTKQLFIENYEDILITSLLAFIDKVDNYVSDGGISFYRYLINILPYRLSSSLSYYKKNNDEISIEDVPIDELIYEDEINNNLGYYILSKFKRIR